MSQTITVNGDLLEWTEGMSVSDVLALKKYTFKMLVVKIDGQLIKKAIWPETVIPAGATVQVIHLMSGG
ncbi:sulfur carrier protein ThiS [bacterium]|nr:sulfur carrier protein ThiS [bacterium]